MWLIIIHLLSSVVQTCSCAFYTSSTISFNLFLCFLHQFNFLCLVSLPFLLSPGLMRVVSITEAPLMFLIPLMFLYELFDVLFFIKCPKFPDPSFVVKKYVTSSSFPTRSGSTAKLVHKHNSTSLLHHSYFCRLVRIWNALPPINLSLSFLSLKLQIKQFFWTIFLTRFDPSIPCSYHFICPCNKCSHSSIVVNFTS